MRILEEALSLCATSSVDGFILVVDSSHWRLSNEETLEDLRRYCFRSYVEHVSRRQPKPLLLLVMNQDSHNCRSLTEIVESWNLHSILDRSWHIQKFCPVSGEGIKEGLIELSRMIRYHKKDQKI